MSLAAPYQDLVRELVCSPAGMVDTEFLRSDALPGRAALGYVEVEGQWRTNVFNLPVVATGDGGAYTTTADMARFWAALMSGRIVREETLADMRDGAQRARPRASPAATASASGWTPTHPRSPCRVPTPGVSFWSSHYPERGTTATVISTTIGGAWPVAELVDSHI